jgi:hypothetical protein
MQIMVEVAELPACAGEQLKGKERERAMNRLFELLALGPALVDEAKRNGKSVNESHLLVHRLLSQAFKEDLARIPKENLRDHLASQLKKLAAA